jgi:hypothetical protein
MTTKEAINAIVTYNTLPPQIDFTLPYRNKAIKAEKYLDKLPPLEHDAAQLEIKTITENYYMEDEDGTSPAYYDAQY